MNGSSLAARPPWSDEVAVTYAERGLSGRLQRGSRPAVIVVDLVRGFTDPAAPPGSDLDTVIEATGTVLEAARGTDAPVIFTTISYTEDELTTTVWLRKMPALRTLVEGTEWVEVDQRLAPRAEEAVVVKKAASAFMGTDLAERLPPQVDSLVVCGATTSGCVRATTIDACALGYPTFVPRDCVGDRAQGPHEANLFDIDAKYGDVIALDQAVDLLVGGGA